MSYVNLLGMHDSHYDLRSFAKAFFGAIGVVDGEERESSNYVDGYYFKGSHNNLAFTVSLSDEDAHEDLPYWIHISSGIEETATLDATVDQLIRRMALPAGFRMARIINFGKRGEQRIDY